MADRVWALGQCSQDNSTTSKLEDQWFPGFGVCFSCLPLLGRPLRPGPRGAGGNWDDITQAAQGDGAWDAPAADDWSAPAAGAAAAATGGW